MNDAARAIFSQVPWLKPFLAWALAAAVVLLVVVIPAYYLFLPVTQRLRAELSRYLAGIRDRHAKNKTERKDSERNLIVRFTQDRLLRLADASSARLWSRTKAALVEPARDIQSRLANVVTRVEEFTKALPKLHEGIQSVSTSIPRDFPLPATGGDATHAAGTLRVARMALVCATFLLIAIVSVNTGMLSQIIRDLGFIPPTLRFFNIPLFYYLAFLITCVEAGFGLVHGVLADVELGDERLKIHVGPALTSVGAVGIACVEGFFYSRIIPTRTETVTLPLIGYTLPQTDVFFIWGFLLVMALFALGLIFYRMFARVLRGTALTTVRRQIGAVTREAVRCSGALQRAETLVTSTQSALASGALAGAASPFASDAVERLLTELHSITSTRPAWVAVREQLLGEAEVIQLARHTLLWFCVALGSALVVIWSGITTFARADYGIQNGLFLALGQAAAVATVGFLSSWGETVVQSADWQKVTAPIWARTFGIGLLAIFIVAELLLLIITHLVFIFWIGNLLACLVLAAACYQLMPLIGLVDIWAQRAVHALLTLCERAYRLVILAFLIAAVLVDQVIALLASPISILKGRRSEPGKALATYANDPR